MVSRPPSSTSSRQVQFLREHLLEQTRPRPRFRNKQALGGAAAERENAKAGAAYRPAAITLLGGAEVMCLADAGRIAFVRHNNLIKTGWPHRVAHGMGGVREL